MTTTDRIRLEGTHPALIRALIAVFRDAEAEGLDLLVIGGLRTDAEQTRLYAIGRTTPPLGNRYKVTNAKPGQSWHNFGLAVDCGPAGAIGKPGWDPLNAGWAQMGTIGERYGLGWGGRWISFADRPHLEMPGGLTLQQARDLYAAKHNSPPTLTPVWAHVTVPAKAAALALVPA